MNTNFSLGIGDKAVLFCETSKTAGIRIVGEGRSGWGTIITIESAKPDIMNELAWTLEQRFVFNSAGEINVGSSDSNANDSTAEALMLLLTRLRTVEQELTRTKDAANREWHKNNPERMGR